MKVESLTLAFTQTVSFDLRFNLNVPSSSGCYVLSNMYREILYIGETGDLSRRMREHLGTPRMVQMTSLGRACWFSYLLVPSERRYQVEQSLLAHHKFAEGALPLLNRTTIV